MDEKPKDFDIIIKYLNNPLDEQLKKEVDAFCALSLENEILFKEIESIWLASAKVNWLSAVNAKKAAKQLRKKLSSEHYNWQRLLYVAAAVLLIGFTWFYVIRKPVESFTIYQTSANQIDSVKLSDGSLIVLAANSSLRVPKQFKEKTREVYLINGEALFHVFRDIKRPFKVNMEASAVEVLGTVFNIKKDSVMLEVGVKSGKVRFSPHQNEEGALLTTGQALDYDLKSEILSRKSAINVDAWLTKKLTFSDTPLEEVCKQLSDYYGISVVFDYKGHHQLKKFNATLNNETLEEALSILKMVYDVKIFKQKNQIVIQKN